MKARGIYLDMLPDGSWAYSSGDSVVTSSGTFPCPFKAPMFNRVKTGSVASKDNLTGDTWILEHGQWVNTHRDSYGVQGHAWGPDGGLVTLTNGPDQESQGLRFYDPSLGGQTNLDVHHSTPGWITGSPSYHPHTPLSESLGVNLYAWTRFVVDGLTFYVGQGHDGMILVQIGSNLHVLSQENGEFVQAHSDGSKVAIAWSVLPAGTVEGTVLVLGDLLALPLLAETPIPVPIPDPPKETPVPDAIPVPNLLDAVVASWNAHEMDRRQVEAWRSGGKPAIQRLQLQWFARLTPLIGGLLPSNWQVKWEHYRNPVPGTDFYYLPDQFLLIDPNKVIHSVKVIAGAPEDIHRANDAYEIDDQGNKRYKWVFGVPTWNDLGVPGPENFTTPDPVADPVDVGPGPFDAPTKPQDGSGSTPEPKPVPGGCSKYKAVLEALEALEKRVLELESKPAPPTVEYVAVVKEDPRKGLPWATHTHGVTVEIKPRDGK